MQEIPVLNCPECNNCKYLFFRRVVLILREIQGIAAGNYGVQ